MAKGDSRGMAAEVRQLMLPRPEKVAMVMREFKQGTLRSSSGRKIRKRKQAVAIALSEARRA